MLAGETVEIVEPVAVLQRQELGGEDEVEGGAEHAARHLLFGQAAEPQVDVVEAQVAARPMKVGIS